VAVASLEAIEDRGVGQEEMELLCGADSMSELM